MRLDHLLSRDLGVCGGRGARTGASPGPLVARREGPDGRMHGSTLLSSFLGVGGARPSSLLWWGGGGMLSGSGAACPLCPASASPCCAAACCGGGVGGCGGVGGLVVNCIVDASIFVLCGVFLLCASRLGPAALSWCGGFWVWFACVVCCFYGRSVDALAPGADEGRGGLR